MLFLKNLIPKALEFTSVEVKQILVNLLESFHSLRDHVDFLGNISQNTMIVQPKRKNISDSVLFRQTVDQQKIDLLDFEAGLVYTHADMVSKKTWFDKKVDALKFNRK